MCAKEMLLVGSLVLGMAVRNVPAQTAAQLISTRSPALALPVSANGDSLNPIVTPDGRFVVFDSTANNLLPAVETGFARQIYRRDRSGNTTVLVSANTNGIGGNADSTSYGVSSDGRYVVFESDASDLVPGDYNGRKDVFVRDTAAGSNILVSVSINGLAGNNASTSPTMTPDGRYVAFVSAANNLVANDNNGLPDIFVHDLITGTTTLVTVGLAPNYYSPYALASYLGPPGMTPDGRYVVFATGFVGLNTNVNFPSGDVYVRDMVANQTIWASTNAAVLARAIHGGVPFQASVHPSISDDGTRVAFETASAIGSTYVVFLYNMTNNTTTVVWTNATANPFGSAAIISGDDAYGPEITPDGRFILFSGLEASTTNASVRLWDAETGTNVLVSANTNGVFSTGSTALAAAMTPDAHYVTFLSDAADLTTNALYPGAPTNQFHIFRRDTVGGGIVMVDADTNGFGENNFYGVDPVMSTNGQFVFFSGPDAGLVPGDVNGAEDVFLWDASTGLPQVLSEANPLLPVRAGSGTSGEDTLFVSGDGRWVAFSSVATNLVPDDTNNAEDVFVCDRWSGTNILVSVAVNGGPALGGASFMPTISTNGRYVAFVSYATNLTPDPIAGAGTNANVFRRDLQTQTTVLVSVNTNGTSSGNWSSASSQAELALSPDGRYVAFYSGASDLAAAATTGGVFLRDIDGGNTVAIATNTGAAFFPITMSTNSRYVAYSSSPRSGVFQTGVWDRNYGTNIFTNAAFFASISPDGSHLLDRYISTVTVWDLVHGTNMLTVTGAERIYTPQVWSGDGRYVVIGTSAAYSGVDLNHAYDIYLFDLLTGTNMLVSVNSTHTGSGSAYSDWPAISGNGRFVVYRSFATNLVAGHTIFPDLYVFDSNTGSNSVLAARQLTSDIINWPLEPVISMDGSTAIFQSTGCGFGLGSLNGVQNVFAALLPSAETADSDGDGIPDWWMIQYFGHVTGQAFDQSLATDDPNGTGMAVLQDYIAGTIPTDPTSVFQLQVPPPAAPSGGLTLTWGAVVGRTYSVQYKNTLDDPAWQPLTGSPVINGNQGQMAVPTDQSTRYFRIVVQ